MCLAKLEDNNVSMISIDKLRIHPVNRQIYVSDKERRLELLKSIREQGILEPLIVTPDKTDHLILSGARRFECAKELGHSELPCIVSIVQDQTLAIIEHNKYRQKTSTEIYNEAQALRKILEPKAKRQQGKRTDLSSNLMEGRDTIDVQKKVAESLNISVGYLSMLEQVMENKQGIPEVVKRLESGRETVYSAYKLLKGKQTSETDSGDNNFTDGAVEIVIPGDVNADGYVGIDDIFEIVSHFGAEYGNPAYSAVCDINSDNYVGVDDIFIAAWHFGEET